MKINIHAGHTSATGKSCGAVSLLNESTENRKVVKELIKILKEEGHTVYDCTAEGISQSDNLVKIVQKCNAHAVDLDISIHFNSGANDKKGNGKSCGSEVWVYPGGSTRKKNAAKAICSELHKLGFTNRGVKTSTGLYVLRRTNAEAILVEVCFVDDKDDYNIYKDKGYKKVAKAIAKGITTK